LSSLPCSGPLFPSLEHHGTFRCTSTLRHSFFRFDLRHCKEPLEAHTFGPDTTIRETGVIIRIVCPSTSVGEGHQRKGSLQDYRGKSRKLTTHTYLYTHTDRHSGSLPVDDATKEWRLFRLNKRRPSRNDTFRMERDRSA
jgi:hypothetical protein